MSIVIKKEKKKINYFIYIALLAFILTVGWFFYSKWLAQEKVFEKKASSSLDVTQGLADIKIKEFNNILNSDKYNNLSNPASFTPPEQKGKTNPFSEISNLGQNNQ